MQNSDQERIHLELARLGIPMSWIADHGLPFYSLADELIVGETDAQGRDYLLTPAAAAAWKLMKEAASQDGLILEIVSSFRTIERQIEIIENKIARNMPMETILTLSAPPGYSEHHSGRAIDINTPGCRPTEEEFANTQAYRWLEQRAAEFDFSLSYPRGNAHGFIYEPWHWCHQS
jgi:D-alanyl-D-alanine carboxypeptidase